MSFTTMPISKTRPNHPAPAQRRAALPKSIDPMVFATRCPSSRAENAKKCAKHEDYHSLAESRGLVSGAPRRRTSLPKSADPTVPTLCPCSHPQPPPNPESSNESTGSWHRGLSCCQVADAENANIEEHCARKRSQRTRRMALCEARWVATVGDGLVSSRLFSPVHGPSKVGSSGYPAESFRKSGRAVLTLSCVLLAFLYLVWKGLGLRQCCMTLLANFCSGFLSINSGLSELHANRSSRCQPTMETIAADYVHSVATGDSDTTSSINVGSESRPTGNFCGDAQNQTPQSATCSRLVPMARAQTSM
jgi:hypothetical protein